MQSVQLVFKYSESVGDIIIFCFSTRVRRNVIYFAIDYIFTLHSALLQGIFFFSNKEKKIIEVTNNTGR